jgi:hypothetical protein
MSELFRTGELGMSETVRAYCGMKARKDIKHRSVSNGAVFEAANLSFLMDFISGGKPMDIEAHIGAALRNYRKTNSVAGSPVEEQRLGKFVNQSLLHKLRYHRPSRDMSAVPVDEDEEDTFDATPVLRPSQSPTRKISLRLSGGTSNLPSNSEYRTLTTIFVKMYWNVSADTAQKVLEPFLACLKKNSGVFQQYSGMFDTKR